MTPMGQRHWWRGIPRLLLVIGLLVALLSSPLANAQGTAVFSRVDVAGNQRIEADSIRVFAGIEPGQPVTPEQLNLAVRNLFDTGLFEDVQVQPEAGRLVITVVENPTINQIAFEGNDSLNDEDLVAVVQLRPRLAYSVAAAEQDAQRIIDAYRAAGRYAASVTPVLIRQSDNRVDLVFEISEGRRTSVQRINFIGNEVFSDRRLRRAIETNQANWLSFLFGNVSYDADKLEFDRELLRQYYLERGYIDFRVLSSTAELARDRTGFFLSFTVSEGERYNYGTVSVSSAVPGLNAADFEPLLGPVADRGIYNVKEIDRVIQRMTFQAGQAGYAFVEIRPQVTKNAATRTVDINFELVEGQRVFVERIDISGNDRTLDRVIRRQFRLVEGDAFNSREIRDAEDRIRGLGYFESATVDVREGTAPGLALVDVQVVEQPTGSLSLGGAYSTTEGFSAQISLTERNFLGRGQTVTGTVSASTQFANYEFGFFEPALFDRDLLAGFTIYYRDRNYEEQSFNTSAIGFVPRIGFPISENGRLTLRYELSSNDIYDVAVDTSRIIQNEAGALTTSAVGLTYAYDRRNSVVDPTAGFILTLNQQFAGLGGDVTHSRTQGTARAYASLFDEDLVLSAELEGGIIVSQDGTRITDRFNTGGDSFRGFARNGLGPRDFCGDHGGQPSVQLGPAGHRIHVPVDHARRL
jgi:outer membrane protein insertion porin family